MGFYTRNGGYIGSAIGNNRAGVFTDGEEQFGRIGPYVAPNTSTATGVYDEFDVFNSRKAGIWPAPITYNVTTFTTTQYENTTYTVTVTTTGLSINTTLYWTVVNGTTTSADFNSVSGSFTQFSSTQTGSFNITTNLRLPSVGNRTYTVAIRTGSVSGPIVATSSTATINGPGTITVGWTSPTINEGGPSTLGITTTTTVGTASSRSFSIAFSGTASSIGGVDFTGLSTSVSTNALNNLLTTTATNDFTTEGTETLIATVTYGANTIGSATLTINDTSLTITVNVTPSVSSINEGSSVTFNVSTTNVSDGTVLYYTLEDSSGAEPDDVDRTWGSFTITSNAGSFVITATSDSLTEGSESFIAKVRTGSSVGTVYATSSAVTINDTSTGTTETTAYYTPSAIAYTVPRLGSTGVLTWPPSGWTSLQNATVDDSFVAVPLPFTWYIAGTGYTTAYVGSNGYVTFGSGSSAYSSLTSANPPNPKIMFGAADNSYQRVAYINNGTLYTRIRFEGTGATSGTVGSPTIVVEFTFFNPANVVGGGSLVEMLVGLHNRTSGLAMVANASTSYATYTLSQNQSYVFSGDSTGVTWTVTSGQSVRYFV